MKNLKIGKIVRSNNHVEYVTHIYNKNEVDNPPAAKDYAFGSFVKIQLNEEESLIGVIFNTVLVDPEYGKAGPRLSTKEEITIFYPDYVDEKTKLVGVLLIGYYDRNVPVHNIPPKAPEVASEVETMTDDEIKQFHNTPNKFKMGYLSLFNEFRAFLAKFLVLNIIRRLLDLFPDYELILENLRRDIEYKMKIERGF